MGDPKGFIKHKRILPHVEYPADRVWHFKEFQLPCDKSHTETQASRCMDCGTPFCHSGCPLGNDIPEFNDAVYAGNWEEAYHILSKTNNFPEFTGRICPAPCEASCVLNINADPVTIEHIEKEIAERAFDAGIVQHFTPLHKTGKSIAVIGSGPAGLAAADQLNKSGHNVTIFERDDQPGGLLRYGIPDFKLEKGIIERRIRIMQKSGIQFQLGCEIGDSIKLETLVETYDAVILCCGSTVPRDLNIPGRQLEGIHFAMDYLTINNRYVAGLEAKVPGELSALGKDVIVIGGGDTGADCVGTAHRQGARSVVQFELLPKPPKGINIETPWPAWPMILRTSTSHEEGGQREWTILTKAFIGKHRIKKLKTVKVVWGKNENGQHTFIEEAGSETIHPCDLVLLAVGFLHPEKQLAKTIGLELDPKGNYVGDQYQTNVENVFVAGDIRRGQSLVVWAIAEGRQAARAVDAYLSENV